MRQFEAELIAKAYHDGWNAHKNQLLIESSTLNGPDPTIYAFIGGPLNGQHLKTGGTLTHRYPHPVDTSSMYSDPMLELYMPSHMTLNIARYALRRSHKGWSAYFFEGWE